MTNYEDEQKKYETWFEKNDKLIGMFAGIKDGDEYLKVGQICLAINDSDDILANIKADHINISATSTAHMLAGSIVYDENGNLVLKESSGGGIYVQRTEQGTTATFGVWDKGNLTGGVMVQEINGQTTTYIKADHVVMGSGQDERPIDVVINGKLNVDELAAKIADIQLLTTQNIFANGSVTASVLAASGSLAVNQNYGITNSGVGYFSALSVTGGTSNATWQSATIHSLSVSDEHAYLYGDANLTPTGRAVGRVVLSHSTSTIHYLGY
jgi:hypothetical protein